MDVSSCDVLIVGGGGAGLRAAIAVAETNPSLRVAVVSKVYPMRSHTVSAEGGAAAVIKAADSLDDHAYDTISGATGSRTRTPWRRSSRSSRGDGCSWSIGAARGAASRMAMSRCDRSGA